MYIMFDKNSDVPIKKQIYDAISYDIISGKLPPGEKMPSTRSLSASLNVARNILVEIFEQLIAEGYLVTIKGRGTYIAAIQKSTMEYQKTEKERYVPKIENDVIAFECGVPDLESFPRREWARYIKESMDDLLRNECGYSHVFGYMPLIIELANYLQKYKGIMCSSSQVFISAGTSDAIGFLALLFRNRCDTFLCEHAAVSFIPDIFKQIGYKIKTIAVDFEGILPSELMDESDKLICVSPSHQFPLGGTLSIERRKQIVDWLIKYNNFLIEDDYDSEFRYRGAPVNSLYQMAPDNVIHVGTFSKTLMPSLRLGYIVFPMQILDEAKELRIMLRKGIELLNQVALYKFMETSKYTKHIMKMKKIYSKKVQYLTDKLRDKFGEDITIYGEKSGLHIAVLFHKYRFNREFTQILLQHKVDIDLLTEYQLKSKQDTNILIFGFGNLSTKEMDIGLNRFYKALSTINQITEN